MPLANDTFLRACRREPVSHTPVWFMRQAGRYLAEYRAIRERASFLEMVKTPAIAAEITLQPIERFAVDAAIIYSDILPPLEGMGLRLSFAQGEGPVIHNPIRTIGDITALRQANAAETMDFTLEAIRLVKQALADRIPLIGFSGAPFTLASYAIEGGSSRDFRRTKLLMYREPHAWQLLMEKLAVLVSGYLMAQIDAGADAVQLFDSWAGNLAPLDYQEYILPYIQQIVTTVRQYADCPIIYFGTDMAGMPHLLRETGADVIGVDWRVRLDNAWEQIGHDRAVQGNLDPAVLFGPWPLIEQRAMAILQQAHGRPGHIFNLGHGILTETPVEHVERLAELVRSNETMKQ
jgi:uroporphyrinogen decarboxylase